MVPLSVTGCNRKRHLSLLHEFLDKDDPYSLNVIGGDYNFVTDIEDRVDLINGEPFGRPCAVANHFEAIFENYFELFQPEMTRFPPRGQIINTSAARLDRIYINHEDLDHTYNIITGTQRTTSDHTCVISILRKRTCSLVHRPIPKFISKKPNFESEVEALLPQLDDNPFAALRQIKSTFAQASNIFTVCSPEPVTSDEERHYWLLRLLDALRDNDDQLPALIKNKLPEVQTLFNNNNLNLASVRGLLADNADRLHFEDTVPQNNSEDPDNGGSFTSKCFQILKTKKKRLGLSGIIDPAGEVITDMNEAMALLDEYWSECFSERRSCHVACEDIFRHARTFPLFNFDITYEELEKQLSRPESSPGPDGIPYSVWAASPQICKQTLFKAYKLWISCSPVPYDFNRAFLWLLPKGSQPGDAPGFCHRAPRDTRPLSGANTDAKTLAGCLNFSMQDALASWAVSAQRGSVKGRSILSNFLDIEQAALSSPDGGRKSAILLLDFSAAYPSISREFLFKSLEAVKLPEQVITAIKSFYKANDHTMKLGHSTMSSFRAGSGVRQGCPLSSTMFTIATDAIISYLQSLLPNATIRAYCDDIAIVLPDVWSCMPTVARAFKVIERASALTLNFRKCALIPCWKFSVSNCQGIIRDIVPSWSEIRIVNSAEYLGFYIGPNAHKSIWTQPVTHVFKTL